MAFNSWDKLTKAQRDYPKPKFAVAVVEKALKKNKANPFLLAWRADLALQCKEDAASTVNRVTLAYTSSQIPELQLLSYLYKISIRALRRVEETLMKNSIGMEYLASWQNFAKAQTSKSNRLLVWDTLFRCATSQECWEDARFAVTQFNKENTTTKTSKTTKASHYTLVAVNQMAAEQKAEWAEESKEMTMMAQIQYGLARKLMKQSFEAPADDPIALSDIKDLRFMADIYSRQDRYQELFALWDKAPDRLAGLMKTHRNDLHALKSRILYHAKMWTHLEEHCREFVLDSLSSQSSSEGKSEALRELCASRLDIWQHLSHALAAIEDQTIQSKHRDMMRLCFENEAITQDRSIRLARLILGDAIDGNEESAPLIDEYWKNHGHLPSCFNDLRKMIAWRPLEVQMSLVNEMTIELPNLSEKNSEEHWKERTKNNLKLEYLTIANQGSAETPPVEAIILRALLFHRRFGGPDMVYLAIYGLHHLHYQHVSPDHSKAPFRQTANSRLLLQAAMLARHMVARDEEKQDRTMCLLAARLHLNLGLGKVAYQMYNHTKCKEMLLDTLSPYVLSQISVTHPFGVKGYQGFSPEEELKKTIDAIETMQKRTESFICTEIPAFAWDRPWEAARLNGDLKNSLTKYMCIGELHRMACLKGDTTEGLPLQENACNDLADNFDRKVFPNFESDLGGPFELIMPAGIMHQDWTKNGYPSSGAAGKPIYRHIGTEGVFYSTPSGLEEQLEPDTTTRTDPIFTELLGWRTMLSTKLLNPEVVFSLSVQEMCAGLQRELDFIGGATANLAMPNKTRLKAEDQPTMFHENMLIYCYTGLEALQVVYSLIEDMRAKLLQAKAAHPIKKEVKREWVVACMESVMANYEVIRKLAESYIKLIETQGKTAIRAQIRWGPTGEHLMKILSEEDVDHYAKEYIDSALEAWRGVLKVKIK